GLKHLMKVIEAFESRKVETVQNDPFKEAILRSYFQAAYLYQMKNDLQKAVDLLEKLIKLDKDFWPAYGRLGALLLQMKKVDEAIVYLQEVLKFNPPVKIELAHVHEALGNAYWMKEKNEDAIHHYKEAIKYNPNFPAALTNLGSLHAMKGEAEEAE